MPNRPTTGANITTQRTVVHTDGACLGNPGPGGWAAIIRHENADGTPVERVALSGGVAHSTNVRMEMTAAVEALKAVPTGPVEIVSDSKLLIDGMSSWLPGWKARGWIKSDRKPVLNADLWRELDRLSEGRGIVWTWVRGHAGHAGNEEADTLASAAAASARLAWVAPT